ncbi:MAG TPA: hypothetical protein PKW33_04945 [Anaerolineaceae bacterium]|nr:hypothetical protein [Anaerolineaceae bacterium]HPN50910.1 hypothetical protein [Anaerolineaceae bacterium]
MKYPQFEETPRRVADEAPEEALAQAWQAVQTRFNAAPMAAPRSGFAGRWKARLPERRLQRQQRVAWICAGTGFGLGWLLLMAVFLSRAFTISPEGLFVSLLYTSAQWIALVQQVQTGLTNIFQAIPGLALLPVAMAALCLITMSLLSLGWMAALGRAYNGQSKIR